MFSCHWYIHISLFCCIKWRVTLKPDFFENGLRTRIWYLNRLKLYCCIRYVFIFLWIHLVRAIYGFFFFTYLFILGNTTFVETVWFCCHHSCLSIVWQLFRNQLSNPIFFIFLFVLLNFYQFFFLWRIYLCMHFFLKFKFFLIFLQFQVFFISLNFNDVFGLCLKFQSTRI